MPQRGRRFGLIATVDTQSLDRASCETDLSRLSVASLARRTDADCCRKFARGANSSKLHCAQNKIVGGTDCDQ